MLFSSPIPFAEALAYRKAQKILPTSAGSAELAKLGAEIRERALFSAKTANAGYLAKMDRMLTGMVSPAARKAQGEMAIDVASFRLEMRAELAKLGYAPDKPGSLQDLGSDARLNLIADMQLKQAHGYGQYVQSQQSDILDAFPCRELLRGHDRKEKRNWKERWVAKGGKLYSDRMIARKDDSIWTKISRFGTPYPPFDYNSGMVTEEVHRDEAEQLGVVKRSTIIKPDTRGFNDEVQASFPKGISKGLATVLKQVFKVAAGKIILEAIL